MSKIRRRERHAKAAARALARATDEELDDSRRQHEMMEQLAAPLAALTPEMLSGVITTVLERCRNGKTSVALYRAVTTGVDALLGVTAYDEPHGAENAMTGWLGRQKPQL